MVCLSSQLLGHTFSPQYLAFLLSEKQRMLDTKTWTTHYHFVYAPMPDRYGKEEYTALWHNEIAQKHGIQ